MRYRALAVLNGFPKGFACGRRDLPHEKMGKFPYDGDMIRIDDVGPPDWREMMKQELDVGDFAMWDQVADQRWEKRFIRYPSRAEIADDFWVLLGEIQDLLASAPAQGPPLGAHVRCHCERDLAFHFEHALEAGDQQKRLPA